MTLDIQVFAMDRLRRAVSFSGKFLATRKGVMWTLIATIIIISLQVLRYFVTDPGCTNAVYVIDGGEPLPAIRLAVLGDSDCHSYADNIWFPSDGNLRGGKYREQTLQWTEVLARLRGSEIDQGRWGSWGTSRRVARIAGFWGIHLRTPRKQDYEYNFSWAGATCSDLIEAISAQTQQLLRLVAQDKAGWKNGIVQIRIGINTLGRREFLDRVAADGLTSTVMTEVNACGEANESAVRMIRQQQPELKIVLVGILNNSDWPSYFDYWQSSTAQANINSALDLFDKRLRKLATMDSHIEFFDDRAPFKNYFGGRTSDGKPNYRVVELASGIVISNTQGDSPEHAILEDGHGGTLLNALWVRDFIDFMNDRWALNVTPISHWELVDLAKGLKR